MKKKLAALVGLVAVAVVAALLAGPPLADRLSDNKPVVVCAKPLVLFERDRLALRDTLDGWLEANLSGGRPVWRADLAPTDWNFIDVSVQKPGRVAGRIMLGEQWTMFGPIVQGPELDFVMVRDCAGGPWRVVKMKRVGASVSVPAGAPLPG